MSYLLSTSIQTAFKLGKFRERAFVTCASETGIMSAALFLRKIKIEN
jgi:hypothetical protein